MWFLFYFNNCWTLLAETYCQTKTKFLITFLFQCTKWISAGSMAPTSLIIKTFNKKMFLSSKLFKGTVSVISNVPPCKDGNARLTSVPLKPLYNQKSRKLTRKVLISVNKSHFRREIANGKQFKETKAIVNHTLTYLDERSLKITFTFPLIILWRDEAIKS